MEGNRTEAVEGAGVKEEEVNRLIGLAHSRKRNRLKFFNTSEGIALRLSVRGHDVKQGAPFYCALCGQHKGAWRGHRTTFSCGICAVPLCVRTYPGLEESCWSLWHSAKDLQPRTTPRTGPKSSRRLRGKTHQEVGSKDDESRDGEAQDDATRKQSRGTSAGRAGKDTQAQCDSTGRETGSATMRREELCLGEKDNGADTSERSVIVEPKRRKSPSEDSNIQPAARKRRTS